MKVSRKTLLIVINVDWLFVMHRLAIAKEALSQGYEVIVLTKDTGYGDLIKSEGLSFKNLNISRSGVNPIIELKLLFEMYRIYKKLNPSLVYQITMKPVIYGTLISRILKIKTVNAISGLGYNFTQDRKGFIQKIMIVLMKLGFNKRDNYLIFENNDDYSEMNKFGVINRKNKTKVIKGVGVDLEKFKVGIPKKNGKTTILFPARMLWDKGVREFIEAARLLRSNYGLNIIFKLCGMIDTENNESVPKEYMENIEIPGYLEWIGHQSDMVNVYKNSDIIVLPSYREGLPTVLIEACAAGKPIVTTNAVGCKECVDEGVNGFKVPVKSVNELVKALEKLIVNPELRIKMGEASRKKAEEEFDQKEVVKKHLEIYNNLF